MAIRVRIPGPLRQFCGGRSQIEIQAENVAQVLEALEQQFPGIRARLCEDNGELRRFINIYVNDEDIRFLNHLDTALKPGDQVSIIPAIAGGGGPD